MPGFQALGIPYSSVTLNLTVFNIAHTLIPAAGLFYEPVIPGRENILIVDNSILITHPSDTKLMFDLGIRKDIENLYPFWAEQAKQLNLIPEQDVTELLIESGVELSDIDSVIWSHAHVDHVGDMSKFPSSTKLVIGKDTIRDIYDPQSNPNGTLLASDFANRTVHEVDFGATDLRIGGFKALDHFDDGSLYLLDVPGHISGHLAVLARVGDGTTFVLLAGDAFHHVGQIRPSPLLQTVVPIPQDLLTSAEDHISTAHFRSGGADTLSPSFFNITARSGPFFDVPELGVYTDPATSRRSQTQVQAFDANEDVFVIAAHDSTLSFAGLGEGVGVTLFNDWKKAGLQEKVTWQFLNSSDLAWGLSP